MGWALPPLTAAELSGGGTFWVGGDLSWQVAPGYNSMNVTFVGGGAQTYATTGGGLRVGATVTVQKTAGSVLTLDGSFGQVLISISVDVCSRIIINQAGATVSDYCDTPYDSQFIGDTFPVTGLLPTQAVGNLNLQLLNSNPDSVNYTYRTTPVLTALPDNSIQVDITDAPSGHSTYEFYVTWWQ